jgi:uncharacterized protein YegL
MPKIKQEIIIVMDKSGSMGTSRDDVIGGFNTYINDLKKDEDIDAKITLVMFDHNVHKLYSGNPVKNVVELCEKTYCPNGSTALNDALMSAVEDVEARLKKSKAKNKPQVMVIVFTDGEENSSTQYGKDDVNKKRTELEKDGWAFIFMGADMDAWSAGSSYGISKGNTISLGRSAVGASMSYLSNRTKKAAVLSSQRLTGQLSNMAYTASMQNLMEIDEDDMINDAEAVKLKSFIDNSKS